MTAQEILRIVKDCRQKELGFFDEKGRWYSTEDIVWEYCKKNAKRPTAKEPYRWLMAITNENFKKYLEAL